ncbi:putative ferric-chelate reductase 1 [Dendrobates tinctorius]|uniref:putative ferric-chelate reductase 1 n=1 Tax=Dendrobates tinctorius TaxID=92724 RepID=UPI003CCA34CA
MYLFGFLILGFLASHVSTFSNGLVYKACDTMKPEHGTTVSQTTEPPYIVSASSYSYRPGDEITVTLQANPGMHFKGFLLQARTVPGNEIVGHFIVTAQNSQNLNCGNVDSTVTHKDSSSKSSISARWVAPASVSRVIFKATILQSMPIYWVGIESPQLTVFLNSSVTNSPILSAPAASNISITSSLETTTPVSSKPPPTYISSEHCGTQKICLSNPSECDPSKTTNCLFMSSAMTDNGAYNFEISGPSGGYVSIGFSDDQFMGSDDIYICVINSVGQVEIQHAYSEGRKPPLILPLSNVDVRISSYTNGVIQCSFTSKNQISTQLPIYQSRASNGSDLYYIFMAYGSSDNGQIKFHGPGVFSSDTKVNISATSNVTHREQSTPIMVKTHGALMLIAWMTTGSLGMIIARYIKTAAKTPIFGKALWFQIHLVLMVLTLAATIVSFVLAFVQAKGWAYAVGTHAILGCIVMILAFFQPLIAFFRPSPENSQRYIFNWFHGINALVMKVLAVTNLFLGFQFIDHRLGWLVKVMSGFAGWEGLITICLEINAGMAREGNKITSKLCRKKLGEIRGLPAPYLPMWEPIISDCTACRNCKIIAEKIGCSKCGSSTHFTTVTYYALNGLKRKEDGDTFKGGVTFHFFQSIIHELRRLNCSIFNVNNKNTPALPVVTDGGYVQYSRCWRISWVCAHPEKTVIINKKLYYTCAG